MGSNDLMKVKCCNQEFHVDCLNQWLQQKKFTCPMCRNVIDFMGSLPCMRQAITEVLDKLFRDDTGVRYKINTNPFPGAIRVQTVVGPNQFVRLRPLRSNTSDGFFFDYKESKVWIKVIYIPQGVQYPTYELTFAE
jgi:hypothetical protein